MKPHIRVKRYCSGWQASCDGLHWSYGDHLGQAMYFAYINFKRLIGE